MNETQEDVMKAARALSQGAIDAMCMTWDHLYGIMSEEGRAALRSRFEQIAYHDVGPAIARAILAERERCAVLMLNMSDVASRIVAMGWRGNPHMSGDDRNFMGPMQRRRHDDRVSYALECIAAAIRRGDGP